MWTGKGRSGIGDVNIQGTWEDWDGLSPNGRQYKNAITQETRNLSGAEYWHARKADCLDQEPEVWKNGMANVKAFADKSTNKSRAKHLSAFEKACSADRSFERLEKLSIQLDEEYAAEKISSEDWVYARKQLDEKLERAWAKVCKLRGWNASEYGSATSVQGKESTLFYATKKPTNNGNSDDVYKAPNTSLFDSLSDDNVFKKMYFVIKNIKRICKK
jgi:hypothetical protein